MTIEDDRFDRVMLGIIGGVLALLMALFNAVSLKNITLPEDKPVTLHLAKQIEAGARAFLKAEYTALSGFVVVIAILLAALISWENAICFVVGAFLSATSGYFGMVIATISNVRTTLACNGPEGLNAGLRVAFKSGSVMALSVVGSGLVGLSVMYLIFHDWDALSGFAFGGSSIALFARVGGGIYTKAADVGADLVGKVEEELEEDSPDNPATIADNVGDNVGDVAGMGADLFESFVGSLIAAGTIADTSFDAELSGGKGVAFPFYVAGFGAICSILGTFMVRTKSMDELAAEANHSAVVRPVGVDPKSPMSTKSADSVSEKTAVLEGLLYSIRRAIFGTSMLVIGTTALSVGIVFGFDSSLGWDLFACVIIGLLCGNLIGYFTEYSTSYTYFPTQSIAAKSDTGPATVIIQGLGVGMLSTLPPVIFIVITMLGAYYIADPHGVYGIAITAVGMLSTLGVTLATDAFGPVADNAGGIAEMAPESEITDDVRETTDQLDALGNTTAATGKGFAIGSAVLTALALMQAFSDQAKLTIYNDPNKIIPGSNLLDPVVLPGVLLGALMPFVFAALTMLSVGKAAEAIMWECRDQMNKKYFDNKPLEPALCVEISTKASLQEMVTPGVAAVFMPVVVGTLLGASGLMGLLTGAIASGFLLGVMMSNAGGAWDNSKKYVEKGYMGKDKAKHSDNHKATVVGDTVGDPFKDTSGPALNILIKLMSIVSLVLAPELSNEPWNKDRWPIGLVVLIVLVIAGYFYHAVYLKANQLHDIEAILTASRRRKRGAKGHAEEEEMKEAEPADGGDERELASLNVEAADNN